MEGVGGVFSVMVILAVPEQPTASKTVTLIVPGVDTLITWLDCPSDQL